MLLNQSAVITGGANGIGFSIAAEFLKNGVSRVLILDLGEVLDPAKKTELTACNANATIFYAQCDITNMPQLEKVLRDDAIRMMGSIDILVNCAGIFDESNPARCIATNLTALIDCSMIVIDLMTKEKAGRGGTIVNIASIAGLQGFSCGAIYSASKSGVISFTKSVGTDQVFELTGVKMMAVCPGATETGLYSSMSALNCSFPGLNQLEQLMQRMVVQKPSAVGRAVVKIIQDGKPGSVWISDNDSIREVESDTNNLI